MSINKFVAKIVLRYKRSTISNPEGTIVHMGDCNIYKANNPHCSCGLLHDLIGLADDEKAIELYPNYLEDLNKIEDM